MALEPPAAIGTGLAVMGIVYAIHSNMTPTDADIQSLPAGNQDVDSAERKATWLSVGVVSGVALLAKDPTILTMGAVAVIAMAVMTRHSNWTETKTGMLHPSPGQSATATDMSTGPANMDVQSYAALPNQFVSS